MKKKAFERPATFRLVRFTTRLVTSLALSAFAATARGEILFDGPATFPTGGNTSSVAAADFDENGTVDLAVVNIGSAELRLFFGDGSGSFTPGDAVRVGSGPTDLVTADFDSDGHADVAVGNSDGRSLTVLLGDGTGGFRSIRTTSWGERQPRSLIARDFDSDGWLDLAAVLVSDVALAFGDGAGGFSSPRDLLLPATFDVRSVDAGDLDEDGVLDLTVVALDGSPAGAATPSDLIVLRGDGLGGFAVTSRFDVAPAALVCLNHVVADLDADGHLDVAVLDYYTGVHVWRGSGTGTFAANGAFPAGGRAGGFAARPIAADYSADGTLDLVIGNVDSRMTVLEGDGAGAFLSGVSFETASYPTGLAAADLNGDTELDVALSIGEPRGGTGALQVFLSRAFDRFRRGTVNAGRGAIADVLYVNDSAGGPSREVRLLSYVPFNLFVSTPPAATSSVPFAVFVTIGVPNGTTTREWPYGIGTSCLPMLAAHGEPRPREVFNNTGRAALGVPTRPSSPAPSALVTLPSGLGRAVTFFVQGVIADPGSAASRPASLTNGVLVICE